MSNKELLSVCFTGTCPNHTRAELVEMVAGKYEVKDSVTKGLDILVCADPNAGSSKLQKAEKNGVKIMSYDDFLKQLANKEENGVKENSEVAKTTEQEDKDDIRKQADNYLDKEDYQKALELYLKLADQNDADVLRRIGLCYHNLDDKEKAFEYFSKSAELCNARALRNLGLYYENGYFVAQCYEKAVEYYTKGAELGDDGAQSCLGYCYHFGNGVERDYKKAVEWYTKSAEQGNALAKNRLGVCYMKGNGVNKDPEKAVEWYTKAAEQGNMYAQGNLAGCYREGDGIEQDYEKAAEWYTKAAEQGYELAKKALDDLYAQGLVASKNVPKMNDAEFGELTYYGKKGWRGKTTANFNGKESVLTIELEGSAKDKVTDAQRMAYAEYLTKKDAFFSAMQKRAKEVYKGAKDHDLLPKKLYIDREGNYGWKCYTPWNDGYNAVILSDGEVQMAMADVLYNYAEVIANRTKKEWYTEETAYVSLFGELQPMCVTRANYEFEKDEDQEIREGKFTDREVELLLWLTNELNSTDIADDVLEYCNNRYDGTCYYDEEKEDYVDFEPIEKIDLLDELYINKIYLKTQHAAKNKRLPEISLAGECECDPDHGIAICFRGKKLIDIGSEDFGF